MNALRLLFGTLTVIPVKPPATLDRRTAGWAMTLAPVAGIALAVLVAGPLALAEEYADPPALLVAALAVGALAFLTRGMHLDGLADTADGLGSRLRGDEALGIMRRSDIGPFGVLTLVLVLLVQVSALAALVARDLGAPTLVLALVWSRLTVTVLSLRFPPARTDGLGSLVAQSVSRIQALLGVALALAATAAVVALLAADNLLPQDLGAEQAVTVLALALAVLAGPALAAHAVRRLGGVTGDVYGAAVETTFTAVLVLLALA